MYDFNSFYVLKVWDWDFSGGSDCKESVCNVGNPGSIPGSGSSPGEGNGNPLQYSCLGKPMDREEPGGLQFMESQRVGDDLGTKPPPPQKSLYRLFLRPLI